MSGNGQGRIKFLKVREKSLNFIFILTKSQGKLSNILGHVISTMIFLLELEAEGHYYI